VHVEASSIRTGRTDLEELSRLSRGIEICLLLNPKLRRELGKLSF